MGGEGKIKEKKNMKIRLLFTTICLIISKLLFAQVDTFNLIKNICSTDFDFFISHPTTAFDLETNSLLKKRNVVIIENIDSTLKNISQNIPLEEAFPYFLKALYDISIDEKVNIILYSITQRSAISIYPYLLNIQRHSLYLEIDSNEWRKNHKEHDILYWLKLYELIRNRKFQD